MEEWKIAKMKNSTSKVEKKLKSDKDVCTLVNNCTKKKNTEIRQNTEMETNHRQITEKS